IEQRGVEHAKPGPAVTMYEFIPAADVKISKITELADDLSLALSSESVRIIAPIPGRDVVGIETSNSKRETVYLKDILANDVFWTDQMKLPMCLGRQADGESKVVDLRKMPHLMVAGTTGSGKSVFVVSAITGLLFKHSPKTLRLILIDPKQVDLAAFNCVPHLLMPPIREPKKAVSALKWAIKEMDKRYRSMSKFGARGLEGYNEIVEKLPKEKLEFHEQTNTEWEQDARKLEQYYFTPQPYIVIVVEEFGDLMAVDKANVENLVVRLAQMARACGIHLVLAMQSPRKDVVTGLIKTNIPGRISFKVASKMDSRIILDDSGAERLLPNGDLLYLAPGVSKPQRHHAPWVTEGEISAIMQFWGDQGEPQYDVLAMRALEGTGGGFDLSGEAEDGGFGGGDEEHDERYDEILAMISGMKEVSASLLQRKFKLGYPRAARMIEIFEKEGVVGPANGSKPRQVLITSFQSK
ncbi:MAG: DNA translocase FtsK, partial [Bdellovibrionota bacterium]